MKLKLVASEVVSWPTPVDVRKGISKLARQLAEAAQALVRWKDGTCIEAPELPGPNEDDDPFVYT